MRVLPPLRSSRGRARRLVARNVVAYRRGWIFLVSGFFEPLFYLLSIGLGLNHLVGHLAIGGRSIPYTDFVAPGLLASSAMNGAIFDSTFGIFFKLKIAKTYDAVLATPLGVRDVAIGELTWSLIRGTLYSIAFLVVMAALGLVGLVLGGVLPARRHARELRLRRGRDVRDVLHAQLAGLRPDLAGHRAVVLVLGRLLPALVVPGRGSASLSRSRPFTRASPCCAASTPVPSVRCSLSTRDISACSE